MATTRRHTTTMKHSPMESTATAPTYGQPAECLSQTTGVKVRKALLLDKDASHVLWLGYGEGRRLVVWQVSDSGFDPYTESSRLALPANPFDMCLVGKKSCVISFANGDLSLVSLGNSELRLTKTYSTVHGPGGADTRKMTITEKTIYSGSSFGSLATVDIETGATKCINTGFAGVRSLSTLSGGTLLATGHSSGQLLIWDTRDFGNNRPSVVTPSRNKLDGITALDKHPAQSNLIAFGTDNGAVGFSDIRGTSGNILPMTYDISSSTVTDVRFHPQNGDHLVCSSADGSIVHWDATRVNSFSFSAMSKESPWLSDKLGDAVSLNVIKNASFSAINSLDIWGDSLLAAKDIQSILVFPSLKFAQTSSNC